MPSPELVLRCQGRWIPRAQVQHAVCRGHHPRPCRRQTAHDDVDGHTGHEGPNSECVIPFVLYLPAFFIQCAPSLVPVAAIILGRDVLLSLSAFYIRYTSLPAPVSRPLLVQSSSRDPFLSRKRSRGIGTFPSLQRKCGQPRSARSGTIVSLLRRTRD